MKDLRALEYEMMENVFGGYNVDDLSPEDLAELQRLGGLLVEQQIMNKNNDPNFSREDIWNYSTNSTLWIKFSEKSTADSDFAQCLCLLRRGFFCAIFRRKKGSAFHWPIPLFNQYYAVMISRGLLHHWRR